MVSFLDSADELLLGLKTLLSVLSCFLGLRPASFNLVSQELLAGFVCLQLVGVLHENLLVFEDIPFDLCIQAIIHMAVKLLRFVVSTEKLAQDPHPSHPGLLLRHLSIGSTLPLPCAHVCLPFCRVKVFFWH